MQNCGAKLREINDNKKFYGDKTRGLFHAKAAFSPALGGKRKPKHSRDERYRPLSPYIRPRRIGAYSANPRVAEGFEAKAFAFSYEAKMLFIKG